MLNFKLNGRDVSVHVPPEAPLLFVLNNDLDVHGLKFGCGLSQCGSCTVLIDGDPVRSCQTAAQSRPLPALWRVANQASSSRHLSTSRPLNADIAFQE
jgi:ferredoxin